MKKELTIRELSEIVNVAEGTIRAWTLKPVVGKVYSVGEVNYDSLREGLGRYFDDQTFTERFGFSIGDVVIIKGKVASTKYIDKTEISEGVEYNLHNYSLVTNVVLSKITKIDDIQVYIFKDGAGFKVLTQEQLDKPNIRFSLV